MKSRSEKVRDGEDGIANTPAACAPPDQIAADTAAATEDISAGSRCNGCEATARLSNQQAGSLCSPD